VAAFLIGRCDLAWTNLTRGPQDLKDFARGAGSVVYADVSRDRPDEGCVGMHQSSADRRSIVEYGSSRDVDEAFRRLDNTDLNGGRVRITEDVR